MGFNPSPPIDLVDGLISQLGINNLLMYEIQNNLDEVLRNNG